MVDGDATSDWFIQILPPEWRAQVIVNCISSLSRETACDVKVAKVAKCRNAWGLGDGVVELCRIQGFSQ